MKELILIAIVILAVIFNSCKTWGIKEVHTIKTIEKDTTVYLQGKTVYDTLHIKDSVFINTFNDRTVIDSSSKVQLRFYKDRYNNLLVSCSREPDTIHIPITTHEVQTIVKETPVKDSNMPNWLRTALIITGLFVLLLVIIKQVIK